MVSSGLRKDVWAQRGFREDLQYAEDDEYTRWCRAKGYRVAYREQSVVMHSHNYSLRQAYRRAYGDAFAHSATLTDAGEARGVAGRLLGGIMRDAARDLAWCLRARRLREWPHAVTIRAAQRIGRRSGLRHGWHHYHGLTHFSS